MVLDFVGPCVVEAPRRFSVSLVIFFMLVLLGRRVEIHLEIANSCVFSGMGKSGRSTFLGTK